MKSLTKKRMPHRSRPVTKRHPYHVVMTLARGAPESHRRRVRDVFKHWMAVTGERFSLAFNLGVWMPDHIHLVVETPRSEGDLSNALRFLCSKVALEINRAFHRKGPLFRDRFFSRVLRTPSELVKALNYVGRNPVKAKYCTRPEYWRAGGVRDYLMGGPIPGPWKEGASRTDSARSSTQGVIPGLWNDAGGYALTEEPAPCEVSASGDSGHTGTTAPRSLWSFHGYHFRLLGFFDNPRTALLNILSNVTRPRPPSKGRQLRLPFKRGLPRQTSRS